MTANAQYLSSRKVEVYAGGTWVDITNDVISPIKCKYGITGNSLTDRVASTGTLSFILRNDAGCLGNASGYYSPGTVSALSGWKTGINVRLTLGYENETFRKFYGTVSKIKPSSGTNERKLVQVDCVDWMEFAATHPIDLPTLKYNMDISQVVQEIVALMPIKPLHTLYNTGSETFSSVFDTVKKNTKAMSEFQKVAMSELGYIYLKRDRTDGETLVVEGRATRTSALSIVPKMVSSSARFLLEDGSYLLQHDGSQIALDETVTMTFDNSMRNLDVSYGDNVRNYVKLTCYPRKTSTTTVTLFTLDKPLFIANGKTLSNIICKYTDPENGDGKIAGTSVSVSSFHAWTKSDGTGSEVFPTITSSIFGSTQASLSINNATGAGCYVTTLVLTGYLITLYNPVESISQDSTSINTYGYNELSLDLPYQDNASTIETLAQAIVDYNKDPKLKVNKVTFIGNTNETLLWAFLNIDSGSRINLKETQSGVNDNYFVNGIEFTVDVNGMVTYSWVISKLDEFIS